MKRKTQTLEFNTRPKLRLTEVERIIKRHRIFVPPLSRRTLTNMCEMGDFETAGARPHSRLGWLIYEDSFLKWLREVESVDSVEAIDAVNGR